jgi:hypothetical protein
MHDMPQSYFEEPKRELHAFRRVRETQFNYSKVPIQVNAAP